MGEKMHAKRYKDISIAAKLVVITTLLLQQSEVYGGENDKELCRSDQVQFYGNVIIEERESINRLKEGYISIEVNEDVGVRGDGREEGEEGSNIASHYKHKIPIESIKDKEEIRYSLCVDKKDVRGDSVSLTGKVIDMSNDKKIDYLGETVVKQVSDSNEADIQLAKVDQAASWLASELTIADCSFGSMADDVRGVAIKVKVMVERERQGDGERDEEGDKEGEKDREADRRVGEALPSPSYLSVTLKEKEEETGESDIISVFAGDVSEVYRDNQPLHAFLCAKLPKEYNLYDYSLHAYLHVGWDGLLASNDEEGTARIGDLASQTDLPISFNDSQSEYITSIVIAPYKPN